MLSAVPHLNKQLEMVRLILNLITDNSEIPDALKQHLVDVIAQAVLLADHHSIRGASSEAVGLALDITGGDDITRELRNVTTFENISPNLARRLLARMQREPA